MHRLSLYEDDNPTCITKEKHSFLSVLFSFRRVSGTAFETEIPSHRMAKRSLVLPLVKWRTDRQRPPAYQRAPFGQHETTNIHISARPRLLLLVLLFFLLVQGVCPSSLGVAVSGIVAYTCCSTSVSPKFLFL